MPHLRLNHVDVLPTTYKCTPPSLSVVSYRMLLFAPNPEPVYSSLPQIPINSALHFAQVLLRSRTINTMMKFTLCPVTLQGDATKNVLGKENQKPARTSNISGKSPRPTLETNLCPPSKPPNIPPKDEHIDLGGQRDAIQLQRWIYEVHHENLTFGERMEKEGWEKSSVCTLTEQELEVAPCEMHSGCKDKIDVCNVEVRFSRGIEEA
ncbi:hypothetical protein BJ875DRAFT_457169 [Amylocarpus encephaloides]|uniref:Uncharacterized protein n=1 Tax=Amylocarpus encephaloides TaxID=45428 RepID=A0A9P7YN76_9HELO|nr:hypothetical protein BJ875DRAFT_457169 [Amylocarpus encephaloides]